MTGDHISINKIEVFAYHGVYEKEKKEGQNFYIDAVLYTDLHKAGMSDELKETVNYGDVCSFIRSFSSSTRYDLIEALAENLANALLMRYATLTGVGITVSKPEAPVDVLFKNISVNITREWNEVYLSVGSNMGDKEKYIADALCKLKENKYIKNVVCSKLIITKPYGYTEQDDFLNGAIRLYTLLTPHELLIFLNELEAEAGRKRELHWGPRTLDLDILFYGDRIIYDAPRLIIPHYDIANREFVLKPLMELNPYYVSPLNKKTVAQMYNKIL